jgi:hypothetical protein
MPDWWQIELSNDARSAPRWLGVVATKLVTEDARRRSACPLDTLSLVQALKSLA